MMAIGRFVKDIRTKLNHKVRRHVKHMIFMFASDLLASCRFLYIEIKKNVLDESIISDMEFFSDGVILQFIKKCNNILAISQPRTLYIKSVIEKHIAPIVEHVFDFYRSKLKKVDKLSVLINSDQYEDNIPRLYRANKIEQVNGIQKIIMKRLKTIIV